MRRAVSAFAGMCVITLSVSAAAQTRTPQDIAADLQRIAAEVEQLAVPMTDAPVQTAAALTAALAKGGTIRLQGGTVYNGGPFRLTVPGTVLDCAGATLLAPAGAPALDVPPGVDAHDMTAIGCTGGSAWDQSVFRIGANDSSQTTLDVVPQRIHFVRMSVPTFRGKRGIEVNAADFSCFDCDVEDVWDPAGRDSQAVAISANSPGPVALIGGRYSAGSEVVLVGGDPTKIPGNDPDGILVQGAYLFRPLSWRTDGVKRIVKNIFELKAGRHVRVVDTVMDGCWKDGQDGFAIALTPRFGEEIRDVTFTRVTARHVAAGVRVIGYDDGHPGPQLVGLTLDGLDVTTDPIFGTGARPFLEITSSPQNVTLQHSQFTGAGTTIYTGVGPAWTADGTKVTSGTIGGFVIQGNTLAVQSYGLMTQLGAYGVNWAQAWPDGQIHGNTFVGANAAKLKANLPADNVYEVAA